VPYLLDTNWVIDYLAGEEGAAELIDNLVAEGIGISLITYMEVWGTSGCAPLRSVTRGPEAAGQARELARPGPDHRRHGPRAWSDPGDQESS